MSFLTDFPSSDMFFSLRCCISLLYPELPVAETAQQYHSWVKEKHFEYQDVNCAVQQQQKRAQENVHEQRNDVDVN